MKEGAGCGRPYAYKVEWKPLTTSYRYQGRTSSEYIDSTQKVKCSICGELLERRFEYWKYPLCGAVSCPSCTEQHNPCCDEYRRWWSDKDVLNDNWMLRTFIKVWAANR